MTGAARSVLFLPASNARAVEKARSLPCDIAVLDLEDAVAPEAKVEARRAAQAALLDGGFRPRVGVRVNALDTPWGREDLTALGDAAELIVLPKIETAEAVREAARLAPRAACWAMIETPRAVLGLDAIAGSGPPLEALMLGVNDLATALGCGASPDREPLKSWLAATVAAARAHGLIAVDGVLNRFEDEAGLQAECAQGRLYGFDGKSLIHPRQIAAANAAFAPAADEVARARAIVAAFAAPEAAGLGAIRLDGAMVERLHLKAAERLIARHDVCQAADRA
ncbi:CoA ester lyase [Brevundimonas sp. S30B]|uniref:HpcH/HpaI aldolase/citrate lyase family protein n=1 Tax=unclassified Brevundimonas TaxID=2622653 RepID=UPI00107239B9|nr:MULTISPECIES: CoA ester lyase [unclassified Brevundimonas]QBX37719.1 CoA ester lyase [Brevundimonas sp. MF30-B]TFW00583.1 CoA ester lyase [Brevundimonas sp. S30B]